MAKYLMIQGTSSGCGKSLIVTGLCRIAKRKGINVAPFKAQNMSLQSFITKDGGEIGLAQAVQARASGVDAEIHMNPVLVKPSGQQGLHLVVHGKFYKTVKTQSYGKEKKKLWEAITDSINYLSKKYDLLIIEGAGSPAEINLHEQDIANMAVADYLNSHVFLIGDIDRGGVFASIYGTINLLKNYETLFKGFIINKFRGDRDILLPGIEKLEKLTGKQCLGIVPYLYEIKISEEDGLPSGLSEKAISFNYDKPVKIVILKLRHISNFSDFDPLRFESDVELIYSLKREDLQNADIIIVPGSKKTAEDLNLLRNMQIDELLKELSKKSIEIIGICGGFQMLGNKLIDNYQVESSIKEIEGMGLLPVLTVFYPEKITTQVEGYLCSEPSIKITGYEIHMGVSSGPVNLFKIKRVATGETLGDGMMNKNVWGTYIHGIFESDSLRRWLINRHRIKKGLNPVEYSFSWEKLKESFIDRLADEIEKYLSMEKIWKLIDI